MDGPGYGVLESMYFKSGAKWHLKNHEKNGEKNGKKSEKNIDYVLRHYW